MAIVEMKDVSKSYFGVQALDSVNLSLEAGTVTALAGENGAGKSTFIKVLAGVIKPSSGSVVIDGHPAGSPRDVIDAGVSVIYQELTDVPEMSVVENLFLGRMPSRFGIVNRRKASRLAREALSLVKLDHIDIGTSIRLLSASQRQLVEIARCLMRNAKVIVFDEPTSSLAESEVQTLLSIIRDLRSRGIAILYVSHHLDELFAISDVIAVLRDGNLVARAPIGEWTEERLVSTMLAKDLKRAYPWHPREIGEVVLSVQDISAKGIRKASIEVRSREIVGLVGLAGAGRTELMRAISGVALPRQGTVRMGGRDCGIRSIRDARTAGIVYAPEERKVDGLVLQASIADNLSYGLYGEFSTLGIISGSRRKRFVDRVMSAYGVKAASPSQKIRTLSGGNQQKVLLGRIAAALPKVILLDDPTRGVDVGAKSNIHSHVLDFVSAGNCAVLTSSDTDEVLEMSDRVYVLRNGQIVAEIERANFDREKILHMATAG